MTIVETYRDILKLGLSRKAALSVKCPKCDATTGDPCTGRRDPTNVRVSPHIERYDAFATNARRVVWPKDGAPP